MADWEDENRDAGEENLDTLKEYLTSDYSPWVLEENWSPEAQQLRELAVVSPQLINDAFIFLHFKSLRIVDKEVNEVDDNLLKFRNLEELVLSANKITTINSANLPRKLKVLELCGNEIVSLKDLCFDSPKELQHLGLGFNRLSCPSESTNLSAHYWPNLVSLDLSFNNLTNLCGVVCKMFTLEHLRILMLQGNPLALLPRYHGFTIDSLPKLSVLDDVVISADERQHFKGLSKRQELVQNAAQVVVSIGKLKGLPNPMNPLELEQAAEYPVITYNYYVTYEFISEQASKQMDRTQAVAENTIESHVQDSQVVANVEYHQKPPEGASEAAGTQYVAMNPQLKQAQLDNSVSFYKTTGKSWEEVIENNYRHEHILKDLLGLKAYLLHGTTVAVIEEKTLYWAAEEDCVESANTHASKKDGKAKEKEKQEKGMHGAKDRKASGKQKKKKEALSDLRHDPPTWRTLGSLYVQLEKLMSGETLMATECNFGVLFTEPTAEPPRDKEKKKGKDKKSKSGRESAASNKTTASSKGKGKGKEVSDVLSSDHPPPQPVPLTVEFQVQLVQCMSASEALKQERRLNTF